MRIGPLLIFSPLNKPVFNTRFNCSNETNKTFLEWFVQSLKSDIASWLEYQTCLKFRYLVQTILGQFDNFKHSTKSWSYKKNQIFKKIFLQVLLTTVTKQNFQKIEKIYRNYNYRNWLYRISCDFNYEDVALAVLENTFRILKL